MPGISGFSAMGDEELGEGPAGFEGFVLGPGVAFGGRPFVPAMPSFSPAVPPAFPPPPASPIAGVSPTPRALPLIWQTPPGQYSEFEFEWITEVLFAGIPQERIMDHGGLSTVRDGALLIYSNNLSGPEEAFLAYLERYAREGFSFDLLHLSNENLGHDCSYYAKARRVFRNYFDPAITAPNVSYLPLGFQSGFLNRTGSVPGPAERLHDAAFIGQPKNDRVELIDVLGRMPRRFLHATKAWSCQTALSPGDVAGIYATTRYVPCPKGWVHEDSFRICEALEWGAVPVLRRYGPVDFFSKTLPGHPFPVIDSWEDLPGMVASTDYERLFSESRRWYLDFRRSLPGRMGG